MDRPGPRAALAAALAVALIAAASFALGLLVAERRDPPDLPLAPAPGPSPPPADAAPEGPAPRDAGAPDPKILFDPDSIRLLPDASLRLDLPPDFDAGLEAGRSR